jgi:hypothetical protein
MMVAFQSLRVELCWSVVGVVALAATSGCNRCEKGYTLQDDGTCYASVVVGAETWDTGVLDVDDDPGNVPMALVQGSVRPGDVELTNATELSVELWVDNFMDIYGPDRDSYEPTQNLDADLTGLQAGSSVDFSEEHPGIPLRGREVFMYVRVDFSDRPAPIFFEASDNPYLLRQNEDSELIEIVVDSSTVED